MVWLNVIHGIDYPLPTKSCHNILHLQNWLVTNVDRERLDAQRGRYRKNPKRFIAAVVKWRRNHPEEFRAYERAWRTKNRKRLAAKYRKIAKTSMLEGRLAILQTERK